MALVEDNFEQIKERILQVYQVEKPILNRFREYAKQLKKTNIKQLRSHSANAVLFVSIDGGDNRLFPNPSETNNIL